MYYKLTDLCYFEAGAGKQEHKKPARRFRQCIDTPSLCTRNISLTSSVLYPSQIKAAAIEPALVAAIPENILSGKCF
jgi:hypothetical protein